MLRINGLYEKYTGKDLSMWTPERRAIAAAYWNMVEEMQEEGTWGDIPSRMPLGSTEKPVERI